MEPRGAVTPPSAPRLCYFKPMDHRAGLSMSTMLLLAAVGCGPGGSGGTGDPRIEPNPDPLGNGTKLAELLGQRYDEISDSATTWLDPSDMESLGCSKIPIDVETLVTGTTLTWADDYDETGAGAIGNYYVQDTLATPVANSGMTVFQPGFSPPDLRLVPGDVVDVFGLVTEFPGPSSSKFSYCRTLPEMSGAMEFRFEGSAISPTVIPVADLSTYVDARKWIGMLVTIDNVTWLEPPYESNGRYSIRIDTGSQPPGEDLPTITNEHMDLKAILPDDTAAGSSVARVTGILTYFFGVHIAPRTADDIVF